MFTRATSVELCSQDTTLIELLQLCQMTEQPRFMVHDLSLCSQAESSFVNLSMLSYVPTIDGQWGGLVEGTNDTWNGMIGMLQRKVSK